MSRLLLNVGGFANDLMSAVEMTIREKVGRRWRVKGLSDTKKKDGVAADSRI